MRERLVLELQMITGVITDDLDYLVAVLLKGDSDLDSSNIEYVETAPIKIEGAGESLEDWFSSLKEV